MPFAPMLRPIATAVFIAASIAIAHAAPGSTEAALLIEADTGKVLHAENATVPWYPASLTKLMTAYVTLQAVKNNRMTLDTLLTVSSRAAMQAPSKMGFKAGSTLTVDNALKMLMVKSANDMAVVLAEGVSGSVEKFAAEMNRVSAGLGMTQTHWVNPNGLPADEQISSARDLAILGRAILREFPEYELYWSIPAIQLGKKVMRNHNMLIGRYEGADGMKTGFICASGFNLVASATRKGKRLIVVVLGAKSSPYRGAKAAGLLERGFNRGIMSLLMPSLGSVETLMPVNAEPPDLRDEMCGPRRKRPAAEEADDDTSENATEQANLPPGSAKPSTLVKQPQAPFKAIAVYLGAAKKSAETQFAEARAKLNKLGKLKPAEATNRGQHAASPSVLASTANQSQTGASAPLMSFSAPAKANVPPLTAMPGSQTTNIVAIPLPRPRPKLVNATANRPNPVR